MKPLNLNKMGAKLIKHSEPDFYFIANNDGTTFATTDEWYFSKTKGCYKLSKQNCESLFGVVDVEKLAKEYVKISSVEFDAFKAGFNKAMELNKGKVFTEKDLRKAIKLAQSNEINDKGWVWGDEEIIQSLQQPTEIEVVIEMETISDGLDEMAQPQYAKVPKLDSEGCLILKKI